MITPRAEPRAASVYDQRAVAIDTVDLAGRVDDRSISDAGSTRHPPLRDCATRRFGSDTRADANAPGPPTDGHERRGRGMTAKAIRRSHARKGSFGAVPASARVAGHRARLPLPRQPERPPPRRARYRQAYWCGFPFRQSAVPSSSRNAMTKLESAGLGPNVGPGLAWSGRPTPRLVPATVQPMIEAQATRARRGGRPHHTP